MRELVHDPFYELIEKYHRCIIDYCLIQRDTISEGIHSHKNALLFAMEKMSERIRESEDDPFSWSIILENLRGTKISSSSFLYVPKTRDEIFKNEEKGVSVPYWYAFLRTPHPNGYTVDDFIKVNEVLFPEGTTDLEIYEWTTDWSDYFNDGHEWWGASCWSVYDRLLNRYIVILASTTD